MPRHVRRRAALRSIPGLVAPMAAQTLWGCEYPHRAQEQLKRTISASLSQTEYGRFHGLRGPDDFHALPIATFEELRPWVDRQRQTEGKVLCADPVICYEKTSGSSGTAKYIPYTATLRRQFSSMFGAWAFDVLTRGPKLRTGKLYMSTSPNLGAEERTVTGRPVGLNTDADYVEGWMRPILDRFLVSLPGADRYATGADFKRALALRLATEPDLEVISVWNPSFLDVLLELLDCEAETLAQHLPAAQAAALRHRDWAALWPRLQLISCWDQGAAAPMASRLRERFPHVYVQGKGLLATEAPITIPWIAAAGCIPLVNSVVIELIDASGTVIPLTAGQLGSSYELVVSPLGGLPRYRLGDRVTLTHRYRSVPCIRFVGRSGGVSDLVGEKLNETLVERALDDILPPSTALRTLVPLPGPPARYVLLADEPISPQVGHQLDTALRMAHHYGLARELGQLGPITTVQTPQAAQWLTQREQRRGLKLGDIKPRTLQTTPADGLLQSLLTHTEAS